MKYTLSLMAATKSGYHQTDIREDASLDQASAAGNLLAGRPVAEQLATLNVGEAHLSQTARCRALRTREAADMVRIERTR